MVGVLLFCVGQVIGWGEPYTTRPGAAVIILAVVWWTAESFSLATFRVAAFLALLASVVLLIHVGEGQRLEREHDEFQIELASIELERAALVSRVSAATQALAAEADAAAVAADAEAADATAEATAAGADASDAEEAARRAEGEEQESGRSPDEPPADPEEAAQQAEQSAEQAETSAEEAGQSAEQAELSAEQAGDTARQADLTASTISDAARAEFDARLAEAAALVAACDGDSDDGECKPRRARKQLLSAFLGRLRAFAKDVPSGDLADAIDMRREEVRSQIQVLDEPIAVHRLVIDGADTVVGDFLGGLLEGKARLGGWGWVVLAAVMIILYRMLEIANGHRYGGPVLVNPAGDSTGDLSVAVQRIRMWLGAAELREPAPIPGGEATKQLSSLVQDSATQNQVIDAVVKFFQATAFPKKGAALTVTLDHLSKNDDRLRLAVRVSDHRTGRLMFVQSFEGTDLDSLCSDAAHFCAERVMSGSRTAPLWSAWESGDGSALRCYQQVLMAEQGPGGSLPATQRRESLQSAVSGSPRTGVALVALSNEASLAGDLVVALTLALRAAHAHPRMMVARYRAGVTACMLSTYIPFLDGSARNGTEFQEMLEVIRDRDDDLARRIETGVGDTGDDGSKSEAEVRSRAMLGLAKKELADSWSRCGPRIKHVSGVKFRRVSCGGTGLWISLRRALRQEERSYWLGLVRNRRRRQQLHAAAHISLRLVELRLARLETGSPDLPRRRQLLRASVDELTSGAADEAIALYDAACFYSELASAADADPQCDAEEVEELLRESAHLILAARMAREGHTISAEWADADPDLEFLRSSGPEHWSAVSERLRALEEWAEKGGSESQPADATRPPVADATPSGGRRQDAQAQLVEVAGADRAG